MQPSDEQITTDEVKQWKGVHLLHFQSSSCSQKVRILLAPARFAGKSGAPDPKRDAEIAWWRAFAEEGISRDVARKSGDAFGRAFDKLEELLRVNPWLIGDRISVLELAWFISIRRVVSAGYPLERHPRLEAHYQRLLRRPAFANEVKARGLGGLVFPAFRLYRRISRTGLRSIMA